MMDCKVNQGLSKTAHKKIKVVYYLCQKSGEVESPHLIHGFLHSTHNCLRLRDVKRWLITLRGAGMPDMYSWSCKRTYKNGFIWQDLCNNDVILQPVYKNEYVLMGSEIREQNNVVVEGVCKLCSKKFGASSFDSGLVKDTNRKWRNLSCNSNNLDNINHGMQVANSIFKLEDQHHEDRISIPSNLYKANNCNKTSMVDRDSIHSSTTLNMIERNIMSVDMATQTGESQRHETTMDVDCNDNQILCSNYPMLTMMPPKEKFVSSPSLPNSYIYGINSPKSGHASSSLAMSSLEYVKQQPHSTRSSHCILKKIMSWGGNISNDFHNNASEGSNSNLLMLKSSMGGKNTVANTCTYSNRGKKLWFCRPCGISLASMATTNGCNQVKQTPSGRMYDRYANFSEEASSVKSGIDGSMVTSPICVNKSKFPLV